jgi:hypothetical protein
MMHNRTILIVVSLLALASMMLAGCGTAATPTPAPTAVPPTAVPPTTAPAAAGGTLAVTGLVGKTLTLSEADLRAMTVADITADQPKVGTVKFSGVRLSDLIAAAAVDPAAVSLVMTGSDGYSATIDLATVKACADCMVAFTDTPGTFLAVMPGQAGKLWVKSLAKLEFK